MSETNPTRRLKIKGTFYDIKDAVAREEIGDLGELQTAHKNNLVEAINEAAQSGGGGGETSIFWAEYGTSTSEDIEDAYNSEMLVVMNYYDRVYVLSYYDELMHYAGFTAVENDTVFYAYCDNDVWSASYTEIGNYYKPTTGIPKTDLSSAVQAGLLSQAAKEALLECFENVAWANGNGQTYYDALATALGLALVSISATFTQGQTVIYPDTSLDSLKTMLTVRANYSDSSSRILEDSEYTLSGTLSTGTSIVTVTYKDKTTTFNVTVTARPALVSISADFTQGQTVIYTTDSLDSLKTMLVVTATYSDSSTAVIPETDYTLSGTLTVGTSTITVSYEGETDTFTVTVTEAQPTALHDWDFTQSLTDSIGGITAVESHHDNSHPLTRTSEGLIYDYQGQCIDLGAVYDRGITIDIYVSDVSIVAYNGHVRLLMYGTTNGTGTGVLIFHQNAGWSAYIGSSWASVFTGLTSRSALDTVSESKITIEIADDGTITLSINDVEIGSLNLKAPEKGSNHLYIGSKSSASSGGGFYNAKVKRVVIY